jgi:hypothetical protein
MTGIRRGCHTPIAIGLAAVLIACGGCGRPKGLYPTSGTVTYRGEPAVGATVFLHRFEGPEPAPQFVPTGVVGDDGSFRLSSDTADGAPPGRYHVLIAWLDRSGSAGSVPGTSPAGLGKAGREVARPAPRIRPSPSLPADRLKGRYLDPDHPRLEVEIKAESNTLPPFELTD